MKSIKTPEYFIEEVEIVNRIGILSDIKYYIFYWDTVDLGIFKKKLEPVKKYITHIAHDEYNDSIISTNFDTEKIAKAAIINYLSKGIKLPTNISKIIKV